MKPLFQNLRMEKRFKLSAIAIIIMMGFLASTIFHYYEGNVLQKPYPYNTFLFSPSDRFSDFFDLPLVNSNLNPYFNPIIPSGQYPLVNVLGYLFSLVPPMTAFLLFVAIISAAYITLTYLILWDWGKLPREILLLIVPILFLTYPFLFTMDRGNIEILLFISLLFFLYYFLQKKFVLSAIFLSIAIAMKAFPAVFLILYLPEKKYREMFLSLGLAGLLTIASLALFTGGMYANIKFLVQGSNFSNGPLVLFTGSENMVQRGVSLFTFFKIIFLETGWIAHINMPLFLSIYIKVAALAFVPLAAYVVLKEQILWRRVALLVFAMLLLPQISGDYKLIHLYLPLFLFILTDDYSRLDYFYLLGFGLLMIPKDYYYLPHILSDSLTHDISISVMINIGLMILMSALIVWSGLGKSGSTYMKSTFVQLSQLFTRRKVREMPDHPL